MPTPLQYPLERSRALQKKWLRLVREPPRDRNDDDDDDDEEENDAEEDLGQR